MISIILPFTRKSESNGYHASVRLLMLQKAFRIVDPARRPRCRRADEGGGKGLSRWRSADRKELPKPV